MCGAAKWVTDATYADLVALCQFLLGPASSQVGFVLGYMRAGLWGAFAAWAAFTLPSALIMIACAYGLKFIRTDSAWLHGLKIAAVALSRRRFGAWLCGYARIAQESQWL
jgi:chromate transporter